jgi:hypothetical protein
VERPNRTHAACSGGLQVDGRLFAGAAVGFHLIGDLLAFCETTQAGTLNRTDVHEHVLAAAIRLNEAVTLLVVEPLHRPCRHESLPFVEPDRERPQSIHAAFAHAVKRLTPTVL